MAVERASNASQSLLRIAGLCACALLACKGDKDKASRPSGPPEQPRPPDVATPTPPGPSSGAITPQPIPPGFDFPGDRTELQAWADTWAIDKIVTKAWNLWGGMTAPAGGTGAGLPIWETWCGTEETFAGTCGAGRARPGRPFKNAVQLSHAATARTGADPGLRLVSFNKFNPSMAGYLARRHPGPGGAEFDYTRQTSLAALDKAWPPNTPIADRKVEETPYVPPARGPQATAAIELKPVLFLVKQRGLSPVPLWRGVAGARPSRSSNCQQIDSKCHPDPTLWKTCVLIDPAQPAAPPETQPVPATPAQIASANKVSAFACETYLYAPLSTIYHFTMDAAEAASFNKVQTEPGLTAQAGDHAVLAAMHVNTKEIVNWTWQTFWWQPGQDPPDDFPGSKQGITDKVKGLWRNYAMCTAYNQTQGATSQKMVVCFNPYLETSAGIPDGMQSNCMSCHGTATVGSQFQDGQIQTLSYPGDYDKPIDFNNDPRFKDYTRTDFSWAIPGDSQPPPSK